MNAVKNTLHNIRDLLTKEQTEILKAATFLMIPSLLTKLTGQVVQVITATSLGSGPAINDFQIANTFPEMLANIFVLGIIGAVIIPVLIDSKEKDGEKVFLRVLNTVLNVSVGLFLISTVLIFLFADSVFPWFIENVVQPENWSGNTANVIAMMKVLMLPNLILGWSVFISSGLNVYHRFIVPQLAPLFFNIGRIFSVFVLLPLMDKSPWALVIGVLLGSVLHLLIQLPLANMLGIKYLPVMDFSNKHVRKLFKISLPRTIAFGTEQIGLAITKLIVAGFGSIQIFVYASSLAQVIPSLFGYSFAVASYPTLTKLYIEKKWEELNGILISTINHIVFLAFPFTLAFIILRLPIVRLVFGLFPNTEFNWLDTVSVAWVMLFFSIGVVFTSLKWYLYRMFYAAKDTVTPLVISVASLIITVVGSFAFSNFLSYAPDFALSHIPLDFSHFFTANGSMAAIGGGALAISVASIFEVIMLVLLISKQLVKIDFRELFLSLLTKLIPAVAMILVMYIMYKTWDVLTFPISATEGFSGSTTLNLFLLTTVTMITSFMVYFLIAFLLQVQELKILSRFLNPIFRLGGLRIEK